jgi:protein-tyrosine phosphatase
MPFRPLELPADVPGKLWLASMPGRFETWNAFEAQAERDGVALVVCLTPRDEIAELSPAYHAAVTRGRMPFRWMSVPMRNFGVPQDSAAFRRQIAEITQSLRQGEAVLLHCAAGIGRTGSTAACVLKSLGLPTEEALQRVLDAGSNPQNAQQSGLVEWF